MICLINFSPALTFKMHAFWCTVMWLMDGLCRCTWMRSMISRFCAQQNSKLVIDLKYELKFHSHKLIRQRWRTVTMIFVLENVVPRVSCWSWCIYIYIYMYGSQIQLLHFLIRCWWSIFSILCIMHVLVHRTSKVFIKNM
jgi:hypothetical protein